MRQSPTLKTIACTVQRCLHFIMRGYNRGNCRFVRISLLRAKSRSIHACRRTNVRSTKAHTHKHKRTHAHTHTQTHTYSLSPPIHLLHGTSCTCERQMHERRGCSNRNMNTKSHALQCFTSTPLGGGVGGWKGVAFTPDHEVRGSAADLLNTLLGGEPLTP